MCKRSSQCMWSDAYLWGKSHRSYWGLVLRKNTCYILAAKLLFGTTLFRKAKRITLKITFFPRMPWRGTVRCQASGTQPIKSIRTEGSFWPSVNSQPNQWWYIKEEWSWGSRACVCVSYSLWRVHDISTLLLPQHGSCQPWLSRLRFCLGLWSWITLKIVHHWCAVWKVESCNQKPVILSHSPSEWEGDYCPLLYVLLIC